MKAREDHKAWQRKWRSYGRAPERASTTTGPSNNAGVSTVDAGTGAATSGDAAKVAEASKESAQELKGKRITMVDGKLKLVPDDPFEDIDDGGGEAGGGAGPGTGDAAASADIAGAPADTEPSQYALDDEEHYLDEHEDEDEDEGG